MKKFKTPFRSILNQTISLFALLCFLSCEKKANTPSKVITPTITNDPIANSKIINKTFISKNVTNTVFNINIYLPPSYDSNKNLPILYVIDGQNHFKPMTTEWIDKDFEAIIVGIGADDRNRLENLVPKDTDCNDCGFQKFYKFVTEELIPFIDESYEYNQDQRILYGHSWGGAFALAALFLEKQNDILFHNFLVIDPRNYDITESFLDIKENDIADLKLYLSLSGESSEVSMHRFIKLLREHEELTALKIKYEQFLEETHISLVPLSFDAGLKFILNSPG